ncbi:MAG: DUF1501 domain-containing protein [Ignavibacteriae bacterium]|nr:DUF1501 domain-containing protein [Ignavibacteriota bacterium]
MKRRSFLQKVAATGIVLPMALGFPRVRAFAKAPEGSPFARITAANKDRILIILRLAGGNDGLNTVIPYTNQDYYTARAEGEIAIPANEVIKLPDSSTLGLHPSLAPLLELYNEKKMAIIQNVGYANQNLSHFRSTDIWLSGSDADVYSNSGWFAKYLEQQYPDYPATLPTDPFAIELGTYLSTTLIGNNYYMGVAVGTSDFIPGLPNTDPTASTHAGDEEAYVREIIRQTNIFINSIVAAGLKQTTNKVTYPLNNQLADGLKAISRIIAAGLTTQMYIINIGGYDTHSDQLNGQNNLHKMLADAVLAFQRDMEAFGTDKKVSIMTISEFGRRVISNGTGTDHGSAAPMFVIGSGVKGGIIGSDPVLTDVEGPGNLKMKVDFRQLYASVLGQWYGASEAEITPNALPRHFEQLPIFQTTTAVNEFETDTSLLTLGQNYPNPAQTQTTIPMEGILSGMDAQFTLSSIDGREIVSQTVMPGQKTVTLDTRALPIGTYIYSLKVGKSKRTQTMVIER